MVMRSVLLRGPWRASGTVGSLLVAAAISLHAQSRAPASEPFFDALGHPAIAYDQPHDDDAVARLVRRLDAGEVRLGNQDGSRDASLDLGRGSAFLASVLRALQISPTSQVLVYSKTSLQAPLINPVQPRAIYFNDEVAVASPAGGFIEIAAQDPTRGFQFYVMQPGGANARPMQTPRCLVCHHTYATSGVPGLFTRSVVTSANGTTAPRFGNGTSDHRSPFTDSWAGWYITGRAEGLTHLGNRFVSARAGAETADSQTSFATPVSLADRLHAPHLLTPYSDIVALLVLEHQTHAMNLLTRLGWEVRVARADRPERVAAIAAAAAEELVDYLLFVDESPLPGRIAGTSGFTEDFAARGPRDRRGRSLRQFDLERRIFLYPCSYMIYSRAFAALPDEARAAVFQRLWRVLAGDVRGARYERLTLADRQAIVGILQDTLPGLPDYFDEAKVGR